MIELIKSVPIWVYCVIYALIGILMAFEMAVDAPDEDTPYLLIGLIWPVAMLIGICFFVDELFRDFARGERERRIRKRFFDD